MFVISQDSCNVMHEIDGADMCVSVVRCVCHTLCPLTEDFELLMCHFTKNRVNTATHRAVPMVYMRAIFIRFFIS